MWQECSRDECLKGVGKPSIPVRWVVTNKGDDLRRNVRGRLAAKQLVATYGGDEVEDLFAAMPPFEQI